MNNPFPTSPVGNLHKRIFFTTSIYTKNTTPPHQTKEETQTETDSSSVSPCSKNSTKHDASIFYGTENTVFARASKKLTSRRRKNVRKIRTSHLMTSEYNEQISVFLNAPHFL